MEAQVSKVPLLIVLVSCWFVAAASAVAADGQVYQWVDNAGVTHYSDRPPASGDQAVTVSPLPAPVAPDARRQAEMRAWVAQVNQRVRETIRQDQEYRLKQQAIQAWAGAQAGAVAPPPEPSYASVVLPYGGILPVRHFRRSDWNGAPAHRLHDHGSRSSGYNRPARSFSLGPGTSSSRPTSLLNTAR